MRLLIFFVFFFLSQMSVATNVQEALILAKEENIIERGPDRIAQFAQLQLSDTDSLARFYFYFIGANIEYDYQKRDEILNNSANYNYGELSDLNMVLRQKKALCVGYARLFKALMLLSGADAVEIVGTSKTLDVFLSKELPTVNHVWNAYYSNGKWHLLDITYAHTESWNGMPNEFYFKTPASLFIADNFPLEPEWQLLAEPITKEAFLKLPYVSSMYYQISGASELPVFLPHKKGFLFEHQLENNWFPKVAQINNELEVEQQVKLHHRVFRTAAVLKKKSLDDKKEATILRLDASTTYALEEHYKLLESLAYFKLDN